MKTIKVRKIKLELYDSIDEMPIANFQKYNKFLLIDSGIGSDLDDFDAHINHLLTFISTNEMDKLKQEILNMRQNLYMINSEISPKYLAFAALIHSINGVEVTDLSDDNLKNILNSLKNARHYKILDVLAKIKKKVTYELETYFPDIFITHKEQIMYGLLKERTFLILDFVSDNHDNDDKINAIDDKINKMYSPKSFMGNNSIEVKFDKQFETLCFLLSQKGNVNAKKMTVLEFYNSISTLNSQNENELKQLKRKR